MSGDKRLERLKSIKQTLDSISGEIEQGHYPPAMLEEFKESVDHIRLTIWTIVTVEEEKRAAGSGYEFGLEQKLVEYRFKRGHKLLQLIQADIDGSKVEISTPGIVDFHHTVQSINDRLMRLLRSGM